jgi:hypothetical protein
VGSKCSRRVVENKISACVLPTRCHQEIKGKHFQRNLSFINNNWPLQRNFFALAHPPKVFFVCFNSFDQQMVHPGLCSRVRNLFSPEQRQFPRLVVLIVRMRRLGRDVRSPPPPISSIVLSQKKNRRCRIFNVLTPDGQSKRPPSHHFCDMYDDNLNSARASLGFSKSNFFFAQPRRLSELVFFRVRRKLEARPKARPKKKIVPGSYPYGSMYNW